MSEITIMKIGSFIVAPIQIELHDRAAIQAQEDIITRIEEARARGLLIDVSKLEVVDSFLGRLIGDTAAMARLMGAETVIVGLQPEVAITLMELGMHLEGIHTALNVEAGMELLEKLTGDMKGEAGAGGEVVGDGD